MAGVTSEILHNMLRSHFVDLKSFAELLNAELTEEGQGDESRVTHKEDVSRVLQAFGESEAFLEKGVKCLQEVEVKINQQFENETLELVELKALRDEIAGIIKIIEGKDRPANDDGVLPNIEVDENKISQQLESIQDVFTEFHPLRLTENADDDDANGANDEEEERISRRLEAMQKKVMSKLEKRMSGAGVADDDEEYAAMLERNDELSDSSEGEEIDYDQLEKCESRSGGQNEDAKRNMDARLKQMWNDYKQQLLNVQPLNTDQLFTEAFDNLGGINFDSLQYHPQFKNSIMELFSREAVVVLRSSMSYVDPISKKNITQPVRNKKCNHIYEKDTIYSILRKKREMRCPLPGCSCCSFTIEDLVEDDAVATRISQSLARKKSSIPQDTEDMETEDEDEGDDAVNVDTENDDTQSQELF